MGAALSETDDNHLSGLPALALGNARVGNPHSEQIVSASFSANRPM